MPCPDCPEPAPIPANQKCFVHARGNVATLLKAALPDVAHDDGSLEIDAPIEGFQRDPSTGRLHLAWPPCLWRLLEIERDSIIGRCMAKPDQTITLAECQSCKRR